ncbi:MAG: SLC13 family permease [Chromatiales bacterium]|nr:SLC13 family permease [Chromatiales bacterium]
MNAHEQAASHVIFGWDPIWVSSILFVLTYAVIITERVNRAIVALVGAGLMISLGVLNQETAIRGVDFNTLGLLTGMMVIVAITRRSGVFQFIAIWSAKRVLARPWAILVMLSVVTAVFSALLDNVTTVLLIAPVTLLITDELEVSPYPFLVAEIFASNIGGTATLIGDPPNIMIGSAVRLTFNDFLINLAPITPLILVVTLVVFYFIYGRGMHATDERRAHIMRFREREAICSRSR